MQDDPIPPQAPVPCRACRRPVDALATVCPHCRSAQVAQGFWRQASVYIPVLSFCVVLAGLLPHLIAAIFAVLNPPQPRIVVTDLEVARPGLAISVANIGEAAGVISSHAVCWADDPDGRAKLGAEFVGRARPHLPAGASMQLSLSAEARGLVRLPARDAAAPGQHEIGRALASDPTPPLRDIRALMNSAGAQSALSGLPVPRLGDSFGMTCTIAVEGPNAPPPIVIRLAVGRPGEGPDDVVWLPDPA